jgi:hypothetical protein
VIRAGIGNLTKSFFILHARNGQNPRIPGRREIRAINGVYSLAAQKINKYKA